METKATKLEALATEIISRDICQELRKQATKLVFGAGNINSNIVFIGEAPGKQEDIQGKPFVGASGEALNKLLESIGLVRTDIYITNIVKYRPPNNRDPLPSEKAEFFPYLERQLELINPKIIATLGRHAMNAFLPKLSISTVHGNILLDSKGRSIFPLFHPAAAMYNSGLKTTLADDFQKLKKYL